ncbi:hypothetical protein NL676_021586 [Syzygium grande]|nr:hypothetical protein NL676_021586 [Syzygium grande]
MLLREALKGGVRQKVELATKFGVSFADGKAEVRGDPAYVRTACKASLKWLDVDCIELYYQHRVDTRVPIEITIGELKKFVGEGKIKYIGLSEALRQQSEEHMRSSHHSGAIGVVAVVKRCGGRDHSPHAGRRFFSVGSKLLENLSKDDFRQSIPRFQPENLAHNAKLFDQVNEIVQRKGFTPSQLALAWVHHQGNDACPIPGTIKIVNFNQNIGALSVKPTPEEMA